jgi:chemotaxis protein CheD
MGEMAVSSETSDELLALGLGSCIGLALIDPVAGVAGLAHVVLPVSGGRADQPGKYADLAVPELIQRMRLAGATERRLEAVLAGGARMFAVGELDIGARNGVAVRTALATARVPVRAAATGGDRGRTVRLAVGPCTVTVREVGGEVVTLFDGSARASRRTRPEPAQPATAEARP